VYLIKYNLFPRNRDPQNSPIRLEELKELVKHWKLHRQRGFWRDHPDKDDLVRALLQHIKSEAANKKRRQEAQDKYRSKTLGDEGGGGSPGKLRDLTTFFGAGTATGNAADAAHNSGDSEREHAVAVAKKKNFGGDLFYQRGDYDEGMIYLSRIDRSQFRTEDCNPYHGLLTASTLAPAALSHLLLASPDATNKQKSGSNTLTTTGNPSTGEKGVLMQQMLGFQTTSTVSAPNLSVAISGGSNNSVSTAVLTKEMKVKCVEGLYSISCHKGYEAQLLREGALATLTSVLKLDDPAIRLYAAATILNLTYHDPVPASPPTPIHKPHLRPSSSSLVTIAPPQATRDLYVKMVDDSVMVALLDLVHTPHATVKALCARALLRFTIDETHHFTMVHEGVVAALSQLMATAATAVASPLAAPNEVKLLCVLALVNLAGVPRAVTCDALLAALVALSRHGDTATRKICAQALLNLSILPTTRGVIVEEGAVAALGVLATAAVAPMQLALLETISCTLCNLAAVKTNQDSLSKNNALTIVSDMLSSVEAALREVQATTKSDVEGGAEGKALVVPLLYTIRKNCVNVVATLCCNPKLHVRMRNAGFIPKLLHILRQNGDDDDDESDNDGEQTSDSSKSRKSVLMASPSLNVGVDVETEKFVVVALANLALDDRCRPTLVQDGAVPVLLHLLHAPEPANTSVQQPQQQGEDAADGIEDKQTSAVLLKLDCVTALSNLLLHPANFQALVDAGVMPAFLNLIRSEDTVAASASSSSREIQKACVYAMLGLAKDPGMKTRLTQATQTSDEKAAGTEQVGAIPTMLMFASKNLAHAELCGICISFLHHLSSRSENHEPLYYEGAVGLLVRVLQKSSTAEPPATTYALWLDCLATLAHLASHTARRATLLEDGVLEAIQRFLTVSASDQRPRDAITDRYIVKAQYAASQIAFKLHELCCRNVGAPAFFACLLLLATQSAAKNSRLAKPTALLQQRTARRCALTIAKVALTAPRGLKLLAEHADIPPALNMVMRTGIHEAQVCAAIALCNLATERPTLASGRLPPRVWRDTTVDDFIVITLLRVNSAQTKAICAKALFNLLTHEDARDRLVHDGALYALLKLARLESDAIRDLALRALYNISLDPSKTTQLLEMELVRVLAKMYQADLSKSMKRFMGGIFSNLSSASCVTNNSSAAARDEEATEGGSGENSGVATGGAANVELQMLQEGALSVLKYLAKVRDPETKLYVANVLYNLSCATDARVAESLVRDESNVLAILVTELKSENRDMRRYAAKTLANLSAVSIAVQVMTADAAVGVVGAINDAMKSGKGTAAPASTGRAPQSASGPSICVETTIACVFTLRNLFSLEINQRKFTACNGLPTLVALLSSVEMAAEAPTLRVATDMVCSLAKLNAGVQMGVVEMVEGTDVSYEERLVKDGVVRALVAIARGAVDGSATRAEESAACMNIVTSLSSLSANARCHDGMLRDGALDALALLCATNASDTRAPFKGLIGVRGEEFALHCMVVIRNLSRQEPPASASVSTPMSLTSGTSSNGSGSGTVPSKAEDVRNQRLAAQPAVVPIVLALAQATLQQTREHVVMALYNLARLRRSKRQLIKNDAVKVLLRLGTTAATPLKRHVCALALQALSAQPPPPMQQPNGTAEAGAAAENGAEWDDPHVDKVVQEGIVAAIAALADPHHQDMMLSLSTSLRAVVPPPPAAVKTVTLVRTTNRAMALQGIPADWSKVLITDLSAWPEIEGGSTGAVTLRTTSGLSLGSISSSLQEDEQQQELEDEDSYSDASDDESRDRKRPSGRQNKAGAFGSSSAVSPKASATKRGELSQPKGNSSLASPRTCSSDTVLGWFQLLADPKLEKVRVNVEFELAGRRAVNSTLSSGSSSANITAFSSSSDELPKLRPGTAPEGTTEDVLRLEGGRVSDGQSTLTQARQAATAASSSSPSYHRGSSNGMAAMPTSSTPSASPLKSPAIAKRRSRQLEPLAPLN
ncbi:hypothetical protein BBJ28_00010812, partial [Nothophytophthora sp. Chile5]